jgi:putative effector of murein hydrolase LrgA (UPF0299 family)
MERYFEAYPILVVCYWLLIVGYWLTHILHQALSNGILGLLHSKSACAD